MGNELDLGSPLATAGALTAESIQEKFDTVQDYLNGQNIGRMQLADNACVSSIGMSREMQLLGHSWTTIAIVPVPGNIFSMKATAWSFLVAAGELHGGAGQGIWLRLQAVSPSGTTLIQTTEETAPFVFANESYGGTLPTPIGITGGVGCYLKFDALYLDGEAGSEVFYGLQAQVWVKTLLEEGA